MAGTANFELLPTDYNRVQLKGYVRKIKLKEESHQSIEDKYSNFSLNGEIVSPVGIVEEPQKKKKKKRMELVSRLEEKINAIIPDYSIVENVVNRAIKIKNVWKENCLANSQLMIDNLNKPLPVEEDEGFQTEEVVELNEVKPVEEVIEENVREDIVVSPEREEEIKQEEVFEDNISEEPMDEIVPEDDGIETEEQTEEIVPKDDEIVIEEPQEQVSKYSERALNPNIDESGEEKEKQLIMPVLPEMPKIDLRLLRNNNENQEGLEIVSSDSRLDMDVESDISEKLENYAGFEEKDNSVDYDLSNDSEIDEMKAALESIKQKKIEQEQSNRAKQQAEEARREEEAKLAEIKRKNIEAVEKIKIQREAISEDIEENLRQEEEERHRIEEIRKQRELQEQLLGELESEILDV